MNIRTVFRGLGVCAALSLVACMGRAGDYEIEQADRGAEVCPGGTLIEGIDVSYWQSTINWSSVAGDGVVYAFIRVSDGNPAEGGTYDTQFQANWTNALAAGVIRGPYQFFRPSDDPVAQADLVISEIGGSMTPGDLPPVLDVEATDGLGASTVAAGIGDWIDRIESQLGVTPIIYTGKYFWQDNVQSSAYSDYPLWHAQYTSAACPNIADQWTEWAFWQYTSSGSVAGISGNVDRNVFNGTMADLQAMTYGDPVCGDGYCNGGEDNSTCPEDCPVCENVPPLGRIVDDQDLCFEQLGSAAYWRYVTDAGYDDTLLWTHTVGTEGEMDNHAEWTLTFDEAGQYRLEAYTDAAYAQSKQARYQVRHDGTVDVVVVDQTTTDGWTDVGDFQFASGDDQWVRLEDYTGEPLADNVQIVFDAVRLTRLDPGPDAGVQQDAGVSQDAGDATGPDAGTDVPRNGEGCNCRTPGSGGGGTPFAGLLLLVGLLWRRRNRGA